MSKNDFVGKVFGEILCGSIGFSSVGSIQINPKDYVNANQQAILVIEQSENKQSQKFYRTKTGKCYHKGNCSCLKKFKIKVSQEEIEEAELNSCQKVVDREFPLL